MGELLCNVVFNVSGTPVSDRTKERLFNEFMMLRDEAVDMLNPHYEQWNAAYTEEVNGEDDPKYNAYIDKLQQSVLDEINRHHPLHRIKLFSKNCDLMGRTKDGTIVSISIIPIKDENGEPKWL